VVNVDIPNIGTINSEKGKKNLGKYIACVRYIDAQFGKNNEMI